MGTIRFLAVSVVGAALAIAAPTAAIAAPGSPSKPHPTTTTTTTPTKNSQAFAKLVIKPASVGHVNVEASGTTTFKPGKNGQALHVGDTVQTDATGQAEIDYADTAYTRLDVNTTFTIKKLTDSQGNRQVEGSLDVGRTYNRTAALTQSQTFQQDGGGATAAVAGTAFVVTCTSSTTCTFTAVIDNINLTGAGGQTKTLNPLDQCVDSNGALCGTTMRLTPDEVALIQWIQTNVYLDLADHGIGDGVFQPFAATVVVRGASVQSVSPAPPAPPGSPPPPPPRPSPPVIDPNNPLQYVSGGDVPNTGGPFTPTVPNQVHSCRPTVTQCQTIAIGDDNTPLVFQVNASDPNLPANPFSIVFTNLTNVNSAGANNTGSLYANSINPGNLVVTNTPYVSTTQFTFAPQEPTTTPATGSFTMKAVNTTTPTIASSPTTVQVTVPRN